MKKKSFSNYLLEFLMMFLAITLGFFAENMRESISEKNKANDLARALITDLVKDTVSLTNSIDLFEDRKKSADSLFELLRHPSFGDIDQRTYYRLIQVVTNYGSFSPSGGTASQLKNLGYLNLLNDDQLFSLLSQYDSLQADYRTNWDREMLTCFVDLMKLLPKVTNTELMYLALHHKNETKIGNRDFQTLQSKKGIDAIATDDVNSFRFNMVVLRTFSSSHVIHFTSLKRTAKEMIVHLKERYKP